MPDQKFKVQKFPDKRKRRLEKVKPKLTLEQAIRKCIRSKLKMDFFYHAYGSPQVLEGYRNVSPVAIGTHKDSGNKVFRAYLNQGVSKSKHTPKWRLFRLDRVGDFNIFYGKYKTRPTYKMDDASMKSVEEQVKKKRKNGK